MRRLMMAVGCACAAGVVGLSAAQDHKMDKSNMDKDMTVTGCVSQSSDVSHFMLTNAMMSGGMHGDMKGDMKAMSFDLMGGDLKAHVGHKVEVTGRMSQGRMKYKKSKDTTDKDKMGMGDKHGALTVKSVKMLSSTCP